MRASMRRTSFLQVDGDVFFLHAGHFHNDDQSVFGLLNVGARDKVAGGDGFLLFRDKLFLLGLPVPAMTQASVTS